MCLLIWTVFSDERCGPWASCFKWNFLKFNTFKYCKDNNSSKSSLFSVTFHFWYSFYFFDFMCKRVTNNILALQKLFSWFYGWLFQVMLCIFRVCFNRYLETLLCEHLNIKQLGDDKCKKVKPIAKHLSLIRD